MNTPFQSFATHEIYSLAEVKSLLAEQALDLTAHFLGSFNPTLSKSNEYRWGKRGSFSLSLKQGKSGLWWDHESSEGGDMLSLIMREQQLGFKESLIWAREWLGSGMNVEADRCVKSIHPYPCVNIEVDIRIKRALAIWDQSKPIHHTIAEIYLQGRGLDIPEGIERTLRFHPACPFLGSSTPALISLLRDIETDLPCGIHRRPLNVRGQKNGSAKMLGKANGAAIKLDVLQSSNARLCIAEGVETALAARQLGYNPMWACGSCGALTTLPALTGIEALVIIADHDEAGLKAARTCATRWLNEQRKVTIIKSPIPNQDANDFLKKAA